MIVKYVWISEYTGVTHFNWQIARDELISFFGIILKLWCMRPQ